MLRTFCAPGKSYHEAESALALSRVQNPWDLFEFPSLVFRVQYSNALRDSICTAESHCKSKRGLNRSVLAVQILLAARIRSEKEGTMTREEYGLAYQRGYDLTIRLLLSRGAPRNRAREVAQAAWTRGWERLSQLRNDSLVGTWVNTIALNVYRSVLRSEPAYQTLPELSTKAGVNLAAIDVARILKICRPRDRVLLIEQMRGVTAEEIARKQGVSETAIRIRLLRARRAARKRVERRAAQIQAAYLQSTGSSKAGLPLAAKLDAAA